MPKVKFWGGGHFGELLSNISTLFGIKSRVQAYIDMQFNAFDYLELLGKIFGLQYVWERLISSLMLTGRHFVGKWVSTIWNNFQHQSILK